MAAAAAECPVCCETYTKQHRKKVECAHCQTACCSGCLQQYLLTLQADAQCMGCKHAFDGEFLSMHLPKTWLLGRYKEHREKVLLDREMALLPGSQDLLVNYRESQRLAEQVEEAETRKRELQRQMFDLTRQIAADRTRLGVLQRSNYTQAPAAAGSSAAAPAQERRQFIRACPVDGCRGFLSTAWRCGTCETWVCKDCGEPKLEGQRDETHVCDPDVAASHAMLQRDSKPCPQCAALIFKVSGCYGKDVPVLLWDGGIKMSQDVRAGDVLVGDDGEPRTVLLTFGGEAQMYRVDQTRGISYTVNGKHTLLFKYSGEGVGAHGERWKVHWLDRGAASFRSKVFDDLSEAVTFFDDLRMDPVIEMTVDDYVKLPDAYKKQLVAWKCGGVNWPARPVPLDPYLMGAWLGDGFSNGSGFAGEDPEIISALADWCDAHGAEIVHSAKHVFSVRQAGHPGRPALGQAPPGECRGCGELDAPFALCGVPRRVVQRTTEGNRFKDALRECGVIGNKHVPIEYIVNDRQTRLELLAGIVDTDGWVGNDGKRVTIINTNRAVVDGVETIARSLGFNVNISMRTRKNVTLVIRGKEHATKDYKDQYSINISGMRLDEIPTRVARKKCSASQPNKDELATGFTVTPLDKAEYYGWTVDGNQRFLLADFTVVRNCDQVSSIGGLLGPMRPGSRFQYTCTLTTSIRSQMWCTQCNVAFSWRTGAVVTHGVIHNPHYYEWLRRTRGEVPRQPGDVPCGGMPGAYELDAVLRRGGNVLGYDDLRRIRELHRQLRHVHDLDLPRLRREAEGGGEFQRNADLRLKYLLNQLDEAEWRRKLQRREKKREHAFAVMQVYDMFCGAATDTFRALVQGAQRPKAALEELQHLQRFANESLDVIGKRFNMAAKRLRA